MREIARGELHSKTPLPTVTRDTCVRVAFAAPGATTVALVSRDGSVLASASAAEGALADKGPVCFHADEAPHLEAGMDAVRVVVWAP
jgi:hypothetical protein